MSLTTEQPTGTPPARAVAILGNDAVLAARPATAVQLAHACLRAGFETTIPASWGDELVAAESVRQLAVRGDGGAILCACPHVEAALLAPGDDLATLLVPVVAPPVAAARYVRHVLGDIPVRITYVGRCPSASADPAIDVQLSPAAFLRQLAERGIVLADQPTVFDSVLPPDRRRHCSLPGGTPAPSCLWEGERTRTLIEIESEEYKSELAQHLIAHRRAVIDLAPRLGCACSGAIGTATQASARASVMSGEPPRAAHPVVEAPAELQLSRPIVPRSLAPAVATPPTSPAASRETAVESSHQSREPHRAAPREAPRADSPRTRTPSGPVRAATGHVPTPRRAEGRPLPRAYGAHRRTPPGSRAIGQEPPPPAAAPTTDEPPAPEPRPVEQRAAEQRAAEQRAAEPVATREPREAPGIAYTPVAPAAQSMLAELLVAPGAVPPASVETPPLADAEDDGEKGADAEVEDDFSDDAEFTADEAPSAAHEEEAPVRRASATVITHASSRQATSSIVALVRARAIETYRQPTAFRLRFPKDPRSFAVAGLTVIVAAVLAIAAIRAVRAPDDEREESAPIGASTLGAARADAATLPPALGARSGLSDARTDARSSVRPLVATPPRSNRGARDVTPAPAAHRAPATTSPRRGSTSASAPEATSVAESVAAPTPTLVVPRPAPAESTANRASDAAGAEAPSALATPATPAAPQGLTAAGRDSIQREIQARRARADSIQRRIDSMRAP